MQLTTEQVRAVLDKDEPDYGLAARLGPDALPHLAYLVEAGDPGLASKATYLAGFIDADQSVAVIERAAISPERVVRVAAAGSLSYLTEVPSALAVDLLSDPDAGVRYQALRAVETKHPPGVEAKVREIAEHDPEREVRERARRMAESRP